jgi:hypothetical protein
MPGPGGISDNPAYDGVLAQPAGENEKHNADQGATERYQGELNLGAERPGDGLRAGCNPAIPPFICCSTLCGEGFEEWDDPMISGIRWVSELIEVAGGEDVFSGLSRHKSAKDRIVSGREVIAAKPDVIIGSWCGKKFVPAKVSAREGFVAIPAAAEGWLREIKSALILQPGPAALTDGLDALVRIIAEWSRAQ